VLFDGGEALLRTLLGISSGPRALLAASLLIILRTCCIMMRELNGTSEGWTVFCKISIRSARGGRGKKDAYNIMIFSSCVAA
jgi:hypothetical protein